MRIMENGTILMLKSLAAVVLVMSVTVTVANFVLTIKGGNNVFRPFDTNISTRLNILNKTAKEKHKYISHFNVEGLKNVIENVRPSNKDRKEVHSGGHFGLATKEKCHKRLPQVIIAGQYKSVLGH
ncbi:uncharacterized protein LOC128549227 [Mercenaria mercenaria]|uniref:uncharacterized protein LOC128549227 n=1 Tax=Mercenaria mercenaria TaxID=6596 RepID=UPI00234EB85A|nr:uncharacterized protein LOC128549227 [Mercenaria mercenaria]